MTSYLNMNASRGIRNNNPFNIKYNSANNWEGQIGIEPEGVFCQFSSIEYGIRAGFYNLINGYFNAGYDTITTIITRYSATDQQAYIDFVSNELNANPDAVLVPTTDTLINLSKAIMQMEVGTTDYNAYITENMIIEGYNMVPDTIGQWNKDVENIQINTMYASTSIILLLILATSYLYYE